MEITPRKYGSPLIPPVVPGPNASAEEHAAYKRAVSRYKKLKYAREYYYAHRKTKKDEITHLSNEIAELRAVIELQKELLNQIQGLRV